MPNGTSVNTPPIEGRYDGPNDLWNGMWGQAYPNGKGTVQMKFYDLLGTHMIHQKHIYFDLLTCGEHKPPEIPDTVEYEAPSIQKGTMDYNGFNSPKRTDKHIKYRQDAMRDWCNESDEHQIDLPTDTEHTIIMQMIFGSNYTERQLVEGFRNGVINPQTILDEFRATLTTIPDVQLTTLQEVMRENRSDFPAL